MRSRRREFLKVGAVAAGAVTAYAVPGMKAAPAIAPLSVLLQFSGLSVHGRWSRADVTKPYPGWEVLMVYSDHHFPELKIPLANVTSPSGYQEDRSIPGIGVWDLENIDLRIKLDASADRAVTPIEGKRPVTGGVPAPCPDATKSDEFLDISWMADFNKIYGFGLVSDLKNDDPTALPKNLVKGRVRLPKGTIECGRPTMKSYENKMFAYSDCPYPAQFTTDVVRFKSDPATVIKLELVSMLDGLTKNTLTLESSAATPIVIRVENHDPNLAKRALAGEIDSHSYWQHHFLPYHDLLKTKPKGWQTPVVSCCTGSSCDPPFYCIPGCADIA